MNKNILAFDTSTESLSVAVNKGAIVKHRHEVRPRQHGELLLDWLRDVCHQAGISLSDVDALAFGRGPGAFTGVRIATGVVQGLALGLNKLIYPVSSLQTMAQAVISQHQHVVAAIDARMGQIYVGEFINEQGFARLVGEELVIEPDSFQLQVTEPSLFMVGSGAKTYHEILSKRFPKAEFEEETCFPCAAAMIELLNHVNCDIEPQEPAHVAPTYLRNDVAKKKGQQK